MNIFFCITIRFLQPYSHGLGQNGEPEWPPSPLRVMQALAAASAGRWNERSTLRHATTAIRWMESLPPPDIVAAPMVRSSQPYRLYVPDNVADKASVAWSKGHYASIADDRTERDVLSSVIDGEAAHYLYTVSSDPAIWREFVNILTAASRSVTHLGWGVDMAVGDANIIANEQATQLHGERWKPSPTGGIPLRVPKAGTLDDLMRKHTDFLGRLADGGFRPVPPLRVFDIIYYRSQNTSLQHPFRVFELRNTDGARHRYPHSRLIHISGMVRHLAIEAMKKAPPQGVVKDWVETYIAGHAIKNGSEHRQLSYLPLPSVGHQHADPGIRRVMIVAPIGDDHLLDYISKRLGGKQLEPENDEFAGKEPPMLVPVKYDNVARIYTGSAKIWHSFTPVILPGHDDHDPDKRRSLIEKALRQAGIEQPCEFEASAFSWFRKSYSAHKYDRNGHLQGYRRPRYLLSQTGVHLTLRFQEDVPGPLAIGAGRHCGLGLFAPSQYPSIP